MKKGLGLMIKSILATLMVSVLMIASPITAEAVVSSETASYLATKNYSSLSSDVKGLIKPDSAGMTNIKTITLADGTYYYEDINSASIDSKLAASIKGSQATSDVTDITNGLNIGADTNTATQMLSGVTPIISTFLGLAVLLITVFMTVFSAIDIVYIVFPATRNFLENSNSKTKIQIVTDDAQFAVKSASIESGKTPMGTYFGRRVISYIILSIMLFIILTGNISLITNLALKVVSGLLEVITSI